MSGNIEFSHMQLIPLCTINGEERKPLNTNRPIRLS